MGSRRIEQRCIWRDFLVEVRSEPGTEPLDDLSVRLQILVKAVNVLVHHGHRHAFTGHALDLVRMNGAQPPLLC